MMWPSGIMGAVKEAHSCIVTMLATIGYVRTQEITA